MASFKGNACARGCLALLGRSHFLAGAQELLSVASSAPHPVSDARTAQSGSGALHAWAWGREQPALRCFPAEPLCALCASPDGSLVAGGGSSGALWLWQAASGKLLRTWAAHHKAAAALTFSADGSWLVSGGEDTAVTVWALAGACPPSPVHAAPATLRAALTSTPLPPQSWPRGCCWAPRGVCRRPPPPTPGPPTRCP